MLPVMFGIYLRLNTRSSFVLQQSRKFPGKNKEKKSHQTDGWFIRCHRAREDSSFQHAPPLLWPPMVTDVDLSRQQRERTHIFLSLPSILSLSPLSHMFGWHSSSQGLLVRNIESFRFPLLRGCLSISFRRRTHYRL